MRRGLCWQGGFGGQAIWALLIAWGLLGSSAAWGQNLVTNGSFEDGPTCTGAPSLCTINGWTKTGSVAPFSSPEATDGVYTAVFNAAEEVTGGVLSQTISTFSGTPYTLEFDFAAYSPVNSASQSLQVVVEGEAGSTLLTQSVADSGRDPATFIRRSFHFVADGTTATLRFTDTSPTTGSIDALLDAVEVVVAPTGDTYVYDALDRVTRVIHKGGSGEAFVYDAAGNILTRTRFVPEPGLLALLGSGSLMLALLGRRRSRSARTRAGVDARSAGLGLVLMISLLGALVAPRAAQAGDPLKGMSDWQDAVRQQIESAEYEVSWQRAGLRRRAEGWQAPNRAQNFRTHFLDKGIRVTPRVVSDEGENAWEFGLSLESYGRGDASKATASGTPRTDGARVTYHRGDIVEWFLNDHRGLEQGFTLNAPPRARRGSRLGFLRGRSRNASGDAFVALRIDGDVRPVLAADRQSVSFVGAGSPLAIAHYSHLVVVDAEGRELEAWMEVFSDAAGHGIRLVFDDENAAYPVEIDPLLTTPAWSVTGNQPDAGLGFSVAGAGDVNGDGFDDVLVGAPFFDGAGLTNSGRAYLYLGGPSGLSNVPAWFAFRGDEDEARFGYALSGGGDVNNDGFDDFLISSAPGLWPAVTIPGKAYLYLGSPSGPGTLADWVLTGRNDRRLGQSIAIVGDRDEDDDGILENDFNGDEYADIVVGEPGALQSDGTGRVYVFYGQADGHLGGGTTCQGQADGNNTVNCSGGSLEAGVPAPTVFANTISDGDEWGERVAGAGDVNCDEYGDLVLGQPRFANDDRGRVSIFLGTASGVTTTPAFELWGNDVAPTAYGSLEFGRSVAGAGRIDRFVETSPGEACDDVLVGAPGGYSASGLLKAGAVYVIRGVDGDGTDLEWYGPILEGARAGERLGQSVARVGDVNGEENGQSADDFLIGAPGDPTYGSTEGRAYLVLGPTGLDRLKPGGGGTDPENFVWRSDGAEAADYLGNSVAGADVNGDGYADLIVGSASSLSGAIAIQGVLPTKPGQAFVYLGSAPVPFNDLLGLDQIVVSDSYAWIGETGVTDSSSASSPAVSSGSSPGSVLISTGLAQDEVTGSTDWDADGQPDQTTAAMVMAVPPGPGRRTLRFTTQYLVSDPSEAPRATANLRYKYYRAGDPKEADTINRPIILDTPIAEAGQGKKHSPISHAIEIPDPNDDAVTHVGIEVTVTEQTAPAEDSAIVLSNVFFSDLELDDYLTDDYLSDPCQPTDPDWAACEDSNQDLRVDYVANPQPSDITATAGTFRHGMTLIDVPGKMERFDLSISYDSARSREEQLGPKWSHSFASTLEEGEDFSGDGCPDSVYVRPGNGRLEVFEGEYDDILIPAAPHCKFTAKYEGLFTRLIYQNSTVGYRYETTDNYYSDFNPVTADLGNKSYRRHFRSHPNGQYVAYTYEPDTDRVLSILDSRGELYDFVYDDSFDPPRLISVAGSGAQVDFGYSELGFLESVIDANALETLFSYDDDGNLLTITDADGVRLVSNEYESTAGLGFQQTGERVVRQLNAQPGDLGDETFFTGDTKETQYREDGAILEQYDVFGRLVERRSLLASGSSNDLQSCIRGDTWCSVWNYEYNEQNKIVSQIDPLGIVAEMEYDSQGNLICQTDDVNGDPVRKGYVYNARNRLIYEGLQRDLTSADPANLPLCPDGVAGTLPEAGKWFVTQNVYHPTLDYLEWTRDPQARFRNYFYDTTDGSPLEGLLTRVRNPELDSTYYTYDPLGHVQSLQDELGKFTYFTHDLLGRQTSVTDPRGHTSRTNYDAGGRVLSTVNPLLNIEWFTYDAQGRELTRTDADSEVWTKSYTPTGQLESETDPLDNEISYEYDKAGRLIGTTDPLGNSTTRSYDAAGRVTSLTDALGNAVTLVYDEAGNQTEETVPYGDPLSPPLLSTTSYAYDGQGRMESVNDAKGNTTTFEYDTRGEVTKRTEPVHPVLGDRIWERTYTDSGQVATIVDPEGSTTILDYDAMDRIDVMTETQAGRETDYEYDARGQLTEVTVSDLDTNVLSRVLATYDAAGNNTAISDPRDSLKSLLVYTYDELNRITAEEDGLHNSLTIGYDARGLVEQRTNVRNMTIGYTYDQAGRHVKTLATEAVNPGVDDTWWIDETLDANGNSTRSAASSTGVAPLPVGLQRSFDELDRQTERKVELSVCPVDSSPAPGGPANACSSGSQYDRAGNLQTVTYSDGKQVVYAYDELNQLVSVETLWDNRLTTYDYDEVGNLISIDRPDGSQVLYTYDRAGHLRSIDDHIGATDIFKVNFDLDAAGRRVNATFHETPLDLPTAAGASDSFVYDDDNRLIGRNGETLAYDADGNLTNANLAKSADPPSNVSMSYDALNRLVGIGTEVIRYDADGRRVSRTVGSTTTYYLYDTEGRLIEELDTAGAVKARYVHGMGLISREAADGTDRFYHYDSRGSTVALSDDTGVLKDTYAYTAYGSVHRGSSNTTENPFTYNGRDGVVDDDNGLYYMQTRYYAPELMRFIQKDAVYGGDIKRPMSLNRYTFVEGNPIERVDPTGEFFGLDDLFAAVIGFVTGVIVEVVDQAISGEWEWESIIGAGIGGAVAADVLLNTGNPIAAGAAGELAKELATEGLRYASGSDKTRGLLSLVEDVGVSVAAGAVTGGVFGGKAVSIGLKPIGKKFVQKQFKKGAKAGIQGGLSFVGGELRDYAEENLVPSYSGAAPVHYNVAGNPTHIRDLAPITLSEQIR